jgi:hypothetical protein
MEHGRASKSRKLIKLSLADPTENALAQALWLDRKFGKFSAGDASAQLWSESLEAQAWTSYLSGQWAEVMVAARGWLIDQPFSSRPAIMASFVSGAILLDYDASLRFCKFGLRSSPDDFMLLNNSAFSAAEAGDLGSAEEYYARIHPASLSTDPRAVWLATGGLLLYRRGRPIEGKQAYLEAMATGEQGKDPRIPAIASYYLALEERRTNSSEAEHRRQDALKRLKKLPYPEIRLFLDRLEGLSPLQP